MSWVILALLAPLFWGSVNHIDKYLIEKFIKGRGIGSLAIFSALIGLPVALIILLIEPQVFGINNFSKLIMIVNGIFYVAMVIPYLYALEKDEASIVAPLYQLSSVITLLLGYIFLGEALTNVQLLGAVLILLGAIGLSSEFSPGSRPKIKTQVLIFMTISSLLVAVNAIIFKRIAIEESFLVTSFWEYIGMFVAALLLMLIPVYRNEFLSIIRYNTKPALVLNSINEVINIAGKIVFNLATLMAPVALVAFVSEGFQPVFVLGIGIFLTLFFPHISEEDISRKHILRKLLFIGVISGGAVLLS